MNTEEKHKYKPMPIMNYHACLQDTYIVLVFFLILWCVLVQHCINLYMYKTRCNRLFPLFI